MKTFRKITAKEAQELYYSEDYAEFIAERVNIHGIEHLIKIKESEDLWDAFLENIGVTE